MKQKTRHYGSIHVVADTFGENPNVKVEIWEFPSFNKVKLGEFFVPRSSLQRTGQSNFIPLDILQARVKHDLNITFSHYSFTTL